RDVVDGQRAQLDVDPGHFGREPSLREVALVAVDAHDAVGPAPLHLDGEEAGVATDVENGLAAQVPRDRVLDAAPEIARVVAEEVVRRGVHAAQIEVVEPIAQRADSLLDDPAVQLYSAHRHPSLAQTNGSVLVALSSPAVRSARSRSR